MDSNDSNVGLAISPDGTKVFASVCSQTAQTGMLVVIDAAQLTMIGSPIILQSNLPNSIAIVSPDNSHVFIGFEDPRSSLSAVLAYQITGSTTTPLRLAGQFNLPNGELVQGVAASIDSKCIYVLSTDMSDPTAQCVLTMVEIATMAAVGTPTDLIGTWLCVNPVTVSADGTAIYIVSGRTWWLSPEMGQLT
jgi:hypothetical protein